MLYVDPSIVRITYIHPDGEGTATLSLADAISQETGGESVKNDSYVWVVAPALVVVIGMLWLMIQRRKMKDPHRAPLHLAWDSKNYTHVEVEQQ